MRAVFFQAAFINRSSEGCGSGSSVQTEAARFLTAPEVSGRKPANDHGDTLLAQPGAFTHPTRSAMRLREYLVVAACFLCLAAITQTLALVGTPEVRRFLGLCASAALGSSAVGLMLAGAAVALLLAIAAQAWDVATSGPRDAA